MMDVHMLFNSLVGQPLLLLLQLEFSAAAAAGCMLAARAVMDYAHQGWQRPANKLADAQTLLTLSAPAPAPVRRVAQPAANISSPCAFRCDGIVIVAEAVVCIEAPTLIFLIPTLYGTP